MLAIGRIKVYFMVLTQEQATQSPRTQGYLVMALGPVAYIEMAANLAASIRVMDPKRPVCIVHDEDAVIPPALRRFFDQAVALPSDPRYPHVMNKLRLFDVTPYEGTMFVDADCLMMKRDVDRIWAAAAMRCFSITGGIRRSGKWKGIQIEDVLRQEGADYLIQMNAGVFYFDRSDAAATFFRDANEFYLRRRHCLNIAYYHGVRTQTDELYFGVLMGLKGMDAANMANVDGNSWMVSTWRALRCDLDPAVGRSIIYKGDNHLFGLPFLPCKIARLSPTFAHFIGLEPRHCYRRLSHWFREAASKQLAA
jgi:hypothetical protein